MPATLRLTGTGENAVGGRELFRQHKFGAGRPTKANTAVLL